MYIAIKKSMLGESIDQIKEKMSAEGLNSEDYEIIEYAEPEKLYPKECIHEYLTDILKDFDGRTIIKEFCWKCGKIKNISANADEELRNMLKDPRYWRDHDKDIVAKIETGFKRLYGGNDEKKD